MEEKKNLKIKLFGDRILVKILQKRNYGRFVLPDTHRKDLPIGRVVAVGPGYLKEESNKKENIEDKWTPLDTKIGDIIICHPRSGVDVEINNKEYRILTEREMLAILNAEDGCEIIDNDDENNDKI